MPQMLRPHVADRSKRPPGEALVNLRRRLALLSPRDPARTEVIARAAEAYGVSVWTIYRALPRIGPAEVSATVRPRRGHARCPRPRWSVTARSSQRSRSGPRTGRGAVLLDGRAIRLSGGRRRNTGRPGAGSARACSSAQPSTASCAASGLDHARVTRPIAAVRFQAKRSNELWHFDMSPSDLKQVEAPLWIEQGRGKPTLMLFSAVDDHSGVVYDEYRCVYGEDAKSALRFLFNAMAPKPEAELPFQGIPATIYMDNGPVSRSKVFQSVMGSLGVRVLTHMPPSEAERRTPARSKGKVERPFRTIKEVHETLYHFHKPKDEAKANLCRCAARSSPTTTATIAPAAQPGRGLAEAPAAKWRARDVLMGAVLRFRARA